jgi:hypothetical protein
MRASRSKKRAVDARRTQTRGGAGRARKAGAGPLKRPAKTGGKLARASGKVASGKAASGASGNRASGIQSKGGVASPAPRATAPKRPPARVAGENPAPRLPVRAEAGMSSAVGLGAAEARGGAAFEPVVPVPVAERGTPPPLPAPIASFVF